MYVAPQTSGCGLIHSCFLSFFLSFFLSCLCSMFPFSLSLSFSRFAFFNFFRLFLRSLLSPLSVLSLFTLILATFPSFTSVEITRPWVKSFQLCILLIIFRLDLLRMLHSEDQPICIQFISCKLWTNMADLGTWKIGTYYDQVIQDLEII